MARSATLGQQLGDNRRLGRVLAQAPCCMRRGRELRAARTVPSNPELLLCASAIVLAAADWSDIDPMLLKLLRGR